jgi:hypothetical protein
MSIAVPQVLDLLDDMPPIDLFGYGLSRSEPAKQGTLPLGPQADIVAVQIAVAHLPWSSLTPTRRNSVSTVRSSSRISGPIRVAHVRSVKRM